ncbi:ATP-binding protein [Puerhibacterium puerhi]|uniref:ATP-binding protein n=1 Tax=Puerhibacterium puerhi TaxID=2692623 RepID=UPI0013574673|nr:sensor histidine kinase [Puerhibacterium puerhi]
MILDALPDIPRSLTGLAEWAACLIYVLLRPHRVRPLRLGLLAAGALGVLVGVQLLAGTLPHLLWPAGMLAAAAGMFGFIVAAVKAPLRDAGYLCARALVLAELVAALHWQVHSFFFLEAGRLDPGWRVPFFFVVYPLALVAAYLIEARHFRRAEALAVTPRELASALAIAMVTFCMSNLSFLNANTPFSGRLGLEIFYIRTLVDLCGFVALWAQQGQRLQQRAKAEVRAIDGILRSQHEQYLQSKQSIDAVNRRYHDLKHQIDVIRAERDPDRKASYLDDLEASISDYAARADTGSGVLDVILTAKSQQCAARGIKLTHVVDGALLDFLPAMDIAAVFGNALDNAIEGAARVPDPEQRLITMAVFAKDRLAMVTIENSFTGELRMENGQIVTRRADRERHGFGLKSIRYTAEKYGGSVTVNAEDQWFVLRILLPMPRAAAARAGSAEARR